MLLWVIEGDRLLRVRSGLGKLATMQQAFPSRMVSPQEEHRILEAFGHAEELLKFVRRLELSPRVIESPQSYQR